MKACTITESGDYTGATFIECNIGEVLAILQEANGLIS